MTDAARGEASIDGLVDALFEAMDRQDMERFTALNARDTDVVHVGTDRDERWVGWDELEAATRRQFASSGSFRVDVRDRVIKRLADSQVACFFQEMDVRLEDEDGGRRVLEGARLTGVAELRDGRWKLVQSHLSLPAA